MSDSDSNSKTNDKGEVEDKLYYRKVIEWRVSEEADTEEQPETEEDLDSAYNSRSLSQSELSLSSSTELSKWKVPPLHLAPGEKYDCSITSIISPTRFLLRRNEEKFFKLTRLEAGLLY